MIVAVLVTYAAEPERRFLQDECVDCGFSLVFESLPPDIADGFGAKGKLEVVATTPIAAEMKALINR